MIALKVAPFRLEKMHYVLKRAKTQLRAKKCRLLISRGCSKVIAFGSEHVSGVALGRSRKA
jgi:hypothetical protein